MGIAIQICFFNILYGINYHMSADQIKTGIKDAVFAQSAAGLRLFDSLTDLFNREMKVGSVFLGIVEIFKAAIEYKTARTHKRIAVLQAELDSIWAGRASQAIPQARNAQRGQRFTCL
jgi:hypothetical protein